jgi:hypothetical protein
MAKVKDSFKDNEFLELLGSATEATNSDWEAQFCADMLAKFEQYGPEMFISDKQLAVLNNIVNRGQS